MHKMFAVTIIGRYINDQSLVNTDLEMRRNMWKLIMTQRIIVLNTSFVYIVGSATCEFTNKPLTKESCVI